MGIIPLGINYILYPINILRRNIIIPLIIKILIDINYFIL